MFQLVRVEENVTLRDFAELHEMHASTLRSLNDPLENEFLSDFTLESNLGVQRDSLCGGDTSNQKNSLKRKHVASGRGMQAAEGFNVGVGANSRRRVKPGSA